MVPPVSLLLAIGVQAIPTCEAPSAEDVVGIWQMSFHPTHEDLLEPDAGYLVVLPDRTYWLWPNDHLSEPKPDTADHGRWSLTPSGLELAQTEWRAPDGRTIEDPRLPGRNPLRYCYSRSLLVSLGDKNNPRQLPVLRLLRSPDDLNYSFAKIY